MIIDDAIKINEGSRDDYLLFERKARADAIQLGIEALKQVKESRFDPSTWTPQILPGETKD